MADSIYRQDAIDLLKKWADGYKYIETETELQWIPCSETEDLRQAQFSDLLRGEQT